MQISSCIACEKFPCTDVRHDSYILPDINLQPEKILLALVSESSPTNLADYYYAKGEPLFQETTLLAFQDAGIHVSTLQELLDDGVYLTTAIKCGKTGYGISAPTIKECALLLEKELALLTNLRAIMLMGDVAIKALNFIARRNSEPRVIPDIPTYKLRGQEFYYRGIRVFPSYLQAGPSFYIEKSKRKMIAEDIAAAWRLIK